MAMNSGAWSGSPLETLIEDEILGEDLSFTVSYRESLQADTQEDSSEAPISVHAEALSRYSADKSKDEIWRLACVLSQFQAEEPATGAPEWFLPVRGTDIDQFTKNYKKCVVYVWRDECDPCDQMRDSLNSVFEDRTDEAVLLAVYGSDYADYLHDEFDVVGAPTILFIRNGEVFSRLEGPHYEEVVQREWDSL